ncbi:MAG: ADP-ribosyltransferase [Candidatus Paceibacterota bacterium]
MNALWKKQEFCDFVESRPHDFVDCDEIAVWIDNIPKRKYWGLNPNDEDKYLYRWLMILVASVYDPSVTLETDDKALCRIISKYGPSKKWLKAQEQYLSKYRDDFMSSQRKDATFDIIHGYSQYGDVVLNSYLREMMSLDEIDDYMRQKAVFEYVLPDEDLEIRLRYMVNSLNDLIEKAPKLEKDIIVYRGVYKTQFQPGDTIPIKGFLSTSIHIGVALNFTRGGTSPTLLVIHVPAGTPCICNAFQSWDSQEAEILFATGINIIVKTCEPDVLVPSIDDTSSPHEEDDDYDWGFSCSFDKSLSIYHCAISEKSGDK